MDGADPSRHGVLEAIWMKRAKGGPMDPVPYADLATGCGILGNANQGGRRQVTLIQAERWADTEAELGEPVPPTARRANFLVRGLALADCRGRTLRVGAVRILIHGETRPCRLMEETHPGLQAALDPDWRGGVYGEVLDDGVIRLGDPVRWAD